LTLVPRRFIISMSRGLRLHGERWEAVSHWLLEVLAFHLKPERRVELQEDSRVAGGSNEVEAGVNPEVNLLLSLRLLLLSHVHLVLVVHELDNGSPTAGGKGEEMVSAASRLQSTTVRPLDAECRVHYEL
jgi:hypothetical protein